MSQVLDEPARPRGMFDGVLADLSERQRDEVLAAFAAVENCPDPVPEVLLLGLRDATLRRHVAEMLHLVGRTLVRVGSLPRGAQAGPASATTLAWTSGYRDDVVAELTATGFNGLAVQDRAVLVLILIWSVAIPRTEGRLDDDDSWVSARPTPLTELRDHVQVGRGDVRQSLRRLRAAGLVQVARGRDADGTAYLPGPQFHRLTPAARQRLQENLILAAGPDTPLAAAVRARRSERAQPRGER